MGRIVPLLLLSLAACGAAAPDEVVCTMQAVAGLNIRAQDAVSQAPLCNAVVTADDGTGDPERLEKLGEPDCVYAGAWEREGTYAVTVTAPGYRPVTLEGLVVSAGECHVTPVQRTVNLEAR